MSTAKHTPDNHPRPCRCIVVDRAAPAIDVYTTVFAATELLRIPRPDGEIGHAETHESATPCSCRRRVRPALEPFLLVEEPPRDRVSNAAEPPADSAAALLPRRSTCEMFASALPSRTADAFADRN
jgi:hypothetical protein